MIAKSFVLVNVTPFKVSRCRVGTILVEIPHAISRYSDEETRVEISAETVGGVLESLWERFPKLRSRVLNREGNLHAYLLLFQNDEKLPRAGIADRPVSEGDRLEIVALAEGG